MKIQRYIPPAAHPFYPYVQSVFFARGDHARELILPKCNVDILFNLGESICIEKTPRLAGVTTWQKTLVAGLQTGAVVARPQGAVTILGISLKAGTCRAVLPLPLREITDLVVDGAFLFPGIDLLWERLGTEVRFAHRCRHVLDWLAAWVEPPSRAALIRSACGLLERYPDGRRLDEIVQASAVSSRHLRRLFQQHVGVNPSEYLRLSRFVKTLPLMRSPLTLTEIAHEAFYCDQAHFCRDFKEIAGLSPRQYRQEAGPAPGHVFYPREAIPEGDRGVGERYRNAHLR